MKKIILLFVFSLFLTGCRIDNRKGVIVTSVSASSEKNMVEYIATDSNAAGVGVSFLDYPNKFNVGDTLYISKQK